MTNSEIREELRLIWADLEQTTISGKSWVQKGRPASGKWGSARARTDALINALTPPTPDPNPEPVPRAEVAFPVRTTFYYIWYPQTWAALGFKTGNELHPTLGYYDSGVVSVIDNHLRQLAYAKIDLGVLSWHGPGSEHREATIFPLVLDRTRELGLDIKWCAYYEDEGFGDPALATVKSDLAYLNDRYIDHPSFAWHNGKPMIFVYNADDDSSRQEVLDRWKAATAGEWWYCLKVFADYWTFPNQPSHWHQYGPDVRSDRQGGFSYSISPGWKSAGNPPKLPRDPAGWPAVVRAMAASGEPLQIVLTFNEWPEGTAVESGREWQSASGFGVYLDGLAQN